MGNLLGFIIPIALAITQPQLFGIAFKKLRQTAVAARQHATIWNDTFQSILVRTFWKLALLGMAVEVVLAYLIHRAIDSSELPWYVWLVPVFLTVAQCLWAGFNFLADARETVTETVHGKTTTSSNPVYPFWTRMSSHAHPLAWLAFTALGFLAQGGLLEYHALVNSPGYSYGEQQVIILLAFLSKVMYGVMAIAVSSILAWLVVKGTRFLERASTLIAKLIVSIDLNIEFNKNALQEIGGEIDFLDEEEVASKIKYLFTVLFTPIIIFDLAIFIWPSQILAILILFGIIATGLMEFVFGSMGPFAKQITWNERVSKMQLAFKVLPIAGMLAIALAYGMQTATGRNIQVELENLWYGVTYIPAPPWWVSLGCGFFALFAYGFLKKAFVTANEFVKGEDAKSPTISSPKSILGRYAGSWPVFLLWLASGVLAFFLFFTAFYSLLGGAYQFSADPNQRALDLRAVKVNGRALPPITDETWHVVAQIPHANGNVSLEFDAPEPVVGVVEYFKPRKALNDEVNESFGIVASTVPNPVSGFYHHVANFQVPLDFAGEYRIVMNSPHYIKNVEVNNLPAKANPHELWALPAPEPSGRVTAEFWTKEEAYGVVEFSPPRAAMAAGIYFPISVQTTPEKVGEDEKGRDEYAYRHNVDFYVPADFSGKYRVMMRNADRSPQANPYYGKVVRSGEFDHTLPEPPGYWASFCAWWSDLWDWDDDDDYDPPKRVIVYTAPAPRPVYAAPLAPKPCKVKPLKVEPALRDQIAAARNR